MCLQFFNPWRALPVQIEVKLTETVGKFKDPFDPILYCDDIAENKHRHP